METRRFKPSENIIYHLIKSQSSTVETALRELIQNACDAGATQCFITLNEIGFLITDNGKGFASRTDIENFFETFGSPHKENYETKFGRFRMGRCQIMAFASTHWESNHFQMEVDIKHKGLEYQLLEEEQLRCEGCKIRGQWYSSLSYHSLQNLKTCIEEHLAYLFQVEVYLNEERISKSLPQLNPTLETDDMYFFLYAQHKNISVYNLGILVSEASAHGINATGVIVTKKHLSIDITRNRIDPACLIWQRIYKNLSQQYPFPTTTRRKSLSKIHLQYLFIDIFSQSAKFRDISTLKIFKDIHGTSRYSITDLAGYPGPRTPKFTFAWSEYPLTADKLNQAGHVIVLSSDNLMSASYKRDLNKCIEHLFNCVQVIASDTTCSEDIKKHKRWINNYIPFELALKSVSENRCIVEDSGLSKRELCALKSIRSANNIAVGIGERYMSAAFMKNVAGRKIMAGESTHADAWTDGSSYIAINKALLSRLNKGLHSADYFASILIHEWCHFDENTFEHNAEFYRNFHTLVHNSKCHFITSLAYNINKYYAIYLLKAQLKIPTMVSRFVQKRSVENITITPLRQKYMEEIFTLKNTICNSQEIIYSLCEALHNQAITYNVSLSLKEHQQVGKIMQSYYNLETFFGKIAESKKKHSISEESHFENDPSGLPF